MAHTLLGSISLGYEPIWSAHRSIMGYRLHAEIIHPHDVNALHLLEVLGALWKESAPVLMLSTSNNDLLQDLLEHANQDSPWIEIPEYCTYQDHFRSSLRQAAERGAKLIWRGETGHEPAPYLKDCFFKTIRSLSPQEALVSLKVARQAPPIAYGYPSAQHSPVIPHQLYEGLANEMLIGHALDQQGVLGVIGWPIDEILYQHRLEQIHPTRNITQRLIDSIDNDDSLDQIEMYLSEEPVLTYRFLRYANSAAWGFKNTIHCIRHGLMNLGLRKLKEWLEEQLLQAHHNANLEPLRLKMVLRGRIMQQLTHAGVEADLHRELFLCGVLSQLDWFIGEPRGKALHRLALPGRITSAILAKTGPYAPWLEIATAIETRSKQLIQQVSKAHQIPLEAVNRALLRTLVSPL
jgi:c-di-GMP phosphodiesterase